MPKLDPLADQPFSYFTTKNGGVHIQARGKTVTSLKGREAQRFLDKVERADSASQQQHMARATGQFKFGNER